MYTNALPDVVSGDVIEAAWANTTIDDIGAEIQDSLSRSGKGNMSVPLKVVAGSVSAPGLSFVSEANSGFYRASAGDIRMALNSAEAWRVTSAGFRVPADITLAAGNIIPSTAGKGIDFAAQTATAATGAATTAEIFGHYEEGTWTPNLWDSSNSSSEGQDYGLGLQTGWFTRIGRLVFFSGRMVIYSIGTLTTSSGIRIGPLPYTSNNSSQNITPVSVNISGNVNCMSMGGAYALTGRVTAGVNYMNVYQYSSATDGIASLLISDLDITGNPAFTISGFYFV